MAAPLQNKKKTNRKIDTKTIVRFIPVIVCLIVFVATLFMVNDYKIVGKSNTLKANAKHAYYAHEFGKAAAIYSELVDSLKESEDELLLNYANAAFLSSDVYLRSIGIDPTRTDLEKDVDTAKHNAAAVNNTAEQQYSRLAASGRTAIASMAANQLGVHNVKGAAKKSPAGLDSTLRRAMENFKEALLKDPDNDSARYNYELAKKLVEYPEWVLSQVQGLVAKRQYKQASSVLNAAMQRDQRIKQQQQELLKRIQTIVSIDSLDTKTSL